jgi:Mg-chelatase subunit ChlD
MGPSNLISTFRKIPKTSLVIFLFVTVAGRAYGDDRGLGPTEIPTPDKPPPLSKIIPGPYKVLRSTAVYSQPREDSPKIVTITPGTKVQVVNDQENWLEIQSKHGRAPGFIKKDSVIVKKKAPESALHGQMDRTKKMATGGRDKSAEPKVRITSPKEGAQINQDLEVILVSGKVSMGQARKPNVDIFFILDVSASTARYAGVDFGDTGLSTSSVPRRWGGGQIRVYGGGFGMGEPDMMDLRNSILAAEVAATRRFLSQLNSETTRVGLITFGARAEVLQPLTHEFERVKQSLDEVLLSGPYGGTHMVGGIRLGIKELSGFGRSRQRRDAIKVNFLLTDGFPTLPIGGGRSATPEDTNLAINAARISKKAGIKIHVFALGEEALSYPRAAVGIAKQSGGIFTPVVRPADILAVLESVSVVGVEYVEVFNKTTGKRASQLRLASDGFFSSALPVVEGLNRIQVLARASGGAVGKDTVSVFYRSGGQRSLDLEVFLEKEKSLKLEVERLGKSKVEIQREIERSKRENLGQPHEPPPALEEDLQP